MCLCVLAGALSISVSAARQSPVDRIDRLMRQSHARGIFNGNVLVARKETIVYEQAIGYADAALQTPLTLQHRFNIGSITKEFSAVSIMMLAEQGRLAIDGAVSKYLPELPPWAARVSIRQLLDYTSGIPEINWNTIKNDRDVYADLLKITTLESDPGTTFSYTNNNVSLRQFIVERLTGALFNTFVERRIFPPCGMTSSTLNPASDAPFIAKSFNNGFGQDPTDVPITGVVYVTARDLYNWTQCLHAGTIISQRSISTLGHSFNPRNGGLGETVWNGDTLTFREHDGQSRNFEALMTIDLEKGVTVILVDNNKNLKLGVISKAIRAILRDETYAAPWG
jgi:CubicO group peptidase (beta-lactamase class C family)